MLWELKTVIADKIIDEKANYILALKGNHSNLKEEVESLFSVQKPESVDEQIS